MWIWAVRVSRGDALAEGFQTAHPRLNPAAGMVACPAFPERPAVPCKVELSTATWTVNSKLKRLTLSQVSA